MTSPWVPLDQIRQDDELLDALASRSYQGSDPVAGALSGWAAGIDAEAAQMAPLDLASMVPEAEPEAGLPPSQRIPASPRIVKTVQVRGAKVVAILASTAVITSGAGVAAALSGYQVPVISTIVGATAQAASSAKDRQLKELERAEESVKAGNRDEARKILANVIAESVATGLDAEAQVLYNRVQASLGVTPTTLPGGSGVPTDGSGTGGTGTDAPSSGTTGSPGEITNPSLPGDPAPSGGPVLPEQSETPAPTTPDRTTNEPSSQPSETREPPPKEPSATKEPTTPESPSAEPTTREPSTDPRPEEPPVATPEEPPVASPDGPPMASPDGPEASASPKASSTSRDRKTRRPRHRTRPPSPTATHDPVVATPAPAPTPTSTRPATDGNNGRGTRDGNGRGHERSGTDGHATTKKHRKDKQAEKKAKKAERKTKKKAGKDRRRAVVSALPAGVVVVVTDLPGAMGTEFTVAVPLLP